MSQPPELPEIGVRVSLRYLRAPGSEPPMGDVIGHLLQAGPLVRVRSADGVVHECRHSDVLYVRRLTDRPVKNSAIRSVEHAAALAWPGSEYQWLDGWLLRAGPGADLAANSAVPLDMFAHANAIPTIIDWYAQRGLSATLAVPERLLRLPEDIPTRYETRTLVCNLGAAGAATGDVVMGTQPDTDWLAVFDHDVPVEVLTAVVDGAVIFASIPGVAVGRGAVTEGPDGTRWLGLTAVRVAADRSRQGYGRAICAALQAWGAERGASRGYAQVPSGDAVFEFFEAIGFTGQHRSRYIDARLLGSGSAP
ncbi:N-acetylglutamate synthase, CG3035 family [Mycolicibacter virginiensis]|uniref:GNAT family N-acetyltransferase n=1 Tax=Mycolicibacter virginiensis TaxID=1795032 RepID=A0A9X7NYZ8_9MYCO|nr:GNAT family N-acetyltransferase [Mycolicibacter virginiensis]PQM52538.1 GNAT family N-acetyltransferase [Mycolicibacter virginiensis]ULP47987.1 GNAT family N-acetyltransferase [Mycolicibacter virginiensis]